MKHLYFTTPFAQDGFATTTLGKRRVSWIAALPVSDAQMQFAREKSTSALEDHFIAKDVDWENLSWSSSI